MKICHHKGGSSQMHMIVYKGPGGKGGGGLAIFVHTYYVDDPIALKLWQIINSLLLLILVRPILSLNQFYCNITFITSKAAFCWKFSHCYFLHLFDELWGNYYFGFFFSIKRKQEVNNCFHAQILSVFTTVASR